VDGLRANGHDIVDLGDLKQVAFSPDLENPKQQNLSSVAGVVKEVAGAVESAVSGQAWPLVIGGDCSITLGVLAALTGRFENLGLIYFDGDLDLNTPETTRSGIIDGMVLAHILGEGAPELSQVGERQPLLREQDVTLFGYSAQAGGIDPVEVERLETTRMMKYPLEQIRDGVKTAAERALGELECRADHILIHFDIDVIDVAEMPAVDVPHTPGLSLMEAQEALSVFLGSKKSVGLVVTEFNARCDTDGSLARTLTGTIHNAFSHKPPNQHGSTIAD
jgi:arginase